jgi:hypothetical protein
MPWSWPTCVSGLSATNGLLGQLLADPPGAQMSGHSSTPLATLEHCFCLLCTDPGALTIDGRLLHRNVPSRPIPLDELRGRLHELDPHARLTVLTTLLQRARTGSPAWQVGLAGVLLPGLRHLAVHQANGPETAAGETRALIWFRAVLALDRPEMDRRIRWLLDATCAASDSTKSPLVAGISESFSDGCASSRLVGRLSTIFPG